MSRHCWLITGALAFLAACGSDKPRPGEGGDASAEPTAEPAKALALPPQTPLGKSAAELEAEGWTAVEIPPELAARLRDSTPGEPELGSPALRRELRALVQPGNTPSFDSGGFADTVRLIEGALMRMARERREQREAEIVDSLKRAMEPRDPNLDAVSTEPELRRPASKAPSGGDVPIRLASFREEPRFPALVPPLVRWQQSQTRTIQIAPGIEGTETSSSDGSTSTTEIGFKQGNLESTSKSTTPYLRASAEPTAPPPPACRRKRSW